MKASEYFIGSFPTGFSYKFIEQHSEFLYSVGSFIANCKQSYYIYASADIWIWNVGIIKGWKKNIICYQYEIGHFCVAIVIIIKIDVFNL